MFFGFWLMGDVYDVVVRLRTYKSATGVRPASPNAPLMPTLRRPLF
ncbi:MAG: hypothetical protein Ta2G_19970 [Termitinemataceae bacterium]|nr:MAG: hypothetical protein Ta2G_19970 [Termitinemataceae bacterium]